MSSTLRPPRMTPLTDESRKEIAQNLTQYLDNSGYKGKGRRTHEHAAMLGMALMYRALTDGSQHAGLEMMLFVDRQITEAWK